MIFKLGHVNQGCSNGQFGWNRTKITKLNFFLVLKNRTELNRLRTKPNRTEPKRTEQTKVNLLVLLLTKITHVQVVQFHTKYVDILKYLN